MTKQSSHSAASAAIDDLLSDYDFNTFAQTPQHKYERWYAVTLSALALLAGKDRIIYAESNFGTPLGDVRITVLTSNRIIVGVIDPSADGVPMLQAVPRTSLSNLELSASERIDGEGNHAYTWPGVVLVHLTYPGLKSRVELVLGNHGSHSIKPESVTALIDDLSADLVSPSAAPTQ